MKKLLLVIALKIGEIVGVIFVPYLAGWWYRYTPFITTDGPLEKHISQWFAGLLAAIALFCLYGLCLCTIPEWIKANMNLADKILGRKK